MKRKALLSLIFSILLIICCCTISNAKEYKDDSYIINIPSTYTMQEESSSITLTKNTPYTLVQINSTEYVKNGVIIDDELLKSQVENLKTKYENSEYDFELISKSLIETNGCQGMKIVYRVIKSNTPIYMTAYYYISDNYMYSIAVGATNSNNFTSVEKELISTFKTTDTVTYYKGIPFIDVNKNDWYYDSVKYVFNNQMILGTTDNTFSPNGNLTRGMLVTVLWRMEGSPKVATNQFTDVKSSQYYYNAVNWAASKKIINGYGNGKFGPNDNITREQLAVILRNYAQYKKKDVSARADLTKFTDNKKITATLKDGVSWAVAKNIISGKSNGTKVDPHGKATRAEASAMLRSYCLNVK